jgi:hypothetical protein
MIPPVTLPTDSKIRIPVDLKLKPGWKLDQRRRVFVSDSGEKFKPRGDLPKNSRLVYTVPTLARTDPSKLSKPEQELQHYVSDSSAGPNPLRIMSTLFANGRVAEAHIAPRLACQSKQ